MTAENPLPEGAMPEGALEMAREWGRGTLIERLEIVWLEIGAARIVARMPVKGNTQVYGQLHGGATAALCETVGSVGAALATGLDRLVVGIQLSINHLRAVREGHVTATGAPVRTGRSIAVWDMRVEDDEGQLVAAATLTLAIRDS